MVYLGDKWSFLKRPSNAVKSLMPVQSNRSMTTNSVRPDIKRCPISKIFKKSTSDIHAAINISRANETVNSAKRPEKFVPDTQGTIDHRGITLLDEVGPDGDDRQWHYAARKSDRNNRER